MASADLLAQQLRSAQVDVPVGVVTGVVGGPYLVWLLAATVESQEDAHERHPDLSRAGSPPSPAPHPSTPVLRRRRRGCEPRD